jgi:hypothetical protein
VSPTITQLAGLIAGLLAGVAWSLAPGAVTVGRTLLSDEPTALSALCSLVFLIRGLLGSSRRAALEPDSAPGVTGVCFTTVGGSTFWYGGAGVALGMTTAMRPVEGALLLAPELLLLGFATYKLAMAARSPDTSSAGRRTGEERGPGLRHAAVPALAWCAGAALPAALTIWILIRSGLPPFAWTGYRFWSPQGEFFNLRYAWAGSSGITAALDGRIRPHAELGALALLGLPGLSWDWYLGRLWPLLGWLAGPWLWAVARRRGQSDERAAVLAWTAAALGSWALCRIALLSSYFYPAGRLYLPAHAVPLLFLATACGLAVSQRGPWLRLAGYGTAVCMLALITLDFHAFRQAIDPGRRGERIYRHFNRWINLTDQERADQSVPFDPVYAQALGLLDPETVADIKEWGELPPTLHVRRLRRKGLLAWPPPAAPGRASSE